MNSFLNDHTLPEYTGPFRDVIPKYLLYREAQGLKYSHRLAQQLRRMDNLLHEKRMKHTRREIPLKRKVLSNFDAVRSALLQDILNHLVSKISIQDMMITGFSGPATFHTYILWKRYPGCFPYCRRNMIRSHL